MKINILYDFSTNHGGGSRFLAALKHNLEDRGRYASTPAQADAIIFNSYHCLLDVVRLKLRHPGKLFIHRLGPFFYLHRSPSWRIIDRLTISTANLIADAIVWQSRWSLRQATKFNFDRRKMHDIIGNAPDSRYFNHPVKPPFDLPQPIKLIACSWSTNPNKGFALYHYLDNHLNFSKYNMSFIGRTPQNFKNIKQLGILSTPQVATALRQHHIFISGVTNDAYSNTLAEAAACGLPIVAPSSGANEEIIGRGGELFINHSAAVDKIEKVANHYRHYQSNVSPPDIDHITKKYLHIIVRAARHKTHISRFRLAIFYIWLIMVSLSLNLLTKLGFNFPPGLPSSCHES
ncbi:MAG: glycosyltransferase [bacterium]